jgi:uncharacterized Rossmann fold enzyme
LADKELTGLELVYDEAVRDLLFKQVGSEEYAKTLEHIVKIHGLLREEKPTRVSRDTLAVIGANLLGILMIIKHENVNVVTSRAMGLLMQARVRN